MKEYREKNDMSRQEFAKTIRRGAMWMMMSTDLVGSHADRIGEIADELLEIAGRLENMK